MTTVFMFMRIKSRIIQKKGIKALFPIFPKKAKKTPEKGVTPGKGEIGGT